MRKKFETFMTLLMTFLFCFQAAISGFEGFSGNSDGARKNKILVLIIASDDLPVYVKEQKIWRAYMHLDPEHIEAYFMKSNPNLETDCKIDGDTIWTKTVDSISPGLLNKTIASMEILQPRLEEFDYVLRTNLSSFYVFPKLLDQALTLPQEKCYFACFMAHGGYSFGSGAGFMLSPDLVRELVNGKNVLWNDPLLDDVCIGRFLHGRAQTIHAHRIDILNLQTWMDHKDNLPLNYHYRLKHTDGNLRETEEVYVMSELLRKFYNLSISLD